MLAGLIDINYVTIIFIYFEIFIEINLICHTHMSGYFLDFSFAKSGCHGPTAVCTVKTFRFGPNLGIHLFDDGHELYILLSFKRLQKLGKRFFF
jgi:hypothetical protein